MASFLYGPGVRASILGSGLADPIDFLTNVMKVGLSSSVHAPDKDDEFLDDVGADDFIDGELSGTGYTRQTLASKTLTYDTANDRTEWDAADTTYTGIDAGTAAQATVFDDAGASDAAKRMLGNVDSGGFPIVTNSGDVTIAWNAEGLFHATV
jgi:hypothetical protein